MIDLNSNKTKIIVGASLLVIGYTISYFTTPTKIEIKEVVKEKIVESKKNENFKGKTRLETKTTTHPDGTMETVEVTENDGSFTVESDSKEQTKEESKTTTIINPKNFRLGVSYKGSIEDFSIEHLLDYKKNVGLNVQYDTNFLLNGQFIGLQVFGDMTIVVTIGVSL